MTLKELLDNNRFVILDGALGTELERRGAPAGALTNLSNPKLVFEVQREYITAGAQAFVTNSFCMNRIYMQTHGAPAEHFEQVNRVGVQIARRAADNRALVLGEIGTCGQMLEPYGYFKEDQFYSSYLEQAQVIANAGVDAFIVETLTDLREAVIALKVCKENFDLPVIMSMTFATAEKGGRTMMGDRAADAAKKLEAGGADVIGVNCGDFDPLDCAKIVNEYRGACSLPIAAIPNAGHPSLENGETVYNMPTDVFVKEVIAPCIEAGARIAGGCCGTTPEHIKAIAEYTDSLP